MEPGILDIKIYLERVLIELNGESLFSYVVSGLIEGGIEKLVIAANKDNWRRYSQFEQFIDTDIFIDTELKGSAYLAYALESKLPSQYFFVYCHHPITSNHLNSQRVRHKDNSMGVSVFSDYEETKQIPIIFDSEGNVKFIGSKGTENDGYIGAPFILIGNEFAKLAKDDNFQHWPGYYMQKASKGGIKIIGTVADMPPEIDFHHQFQLVVANFSDDRFRPLIL